MTRLHFFVKFDLMLSSFEKTLQLNIANRFLHCNFVCRSIGNTLPLCDINRSVVEWIERLPLKR